MKKYFLTALLGAFCLFGFTSANTVGNFTSDSEICVLNFSSETYYSPTASSCGWSDYTDDICLYAYLDFDGSVPSYIDNGLYCTEHHGVQSISSNPFYLDDVSLWDSGMSFYNQVDGQEIEASGTLYLSYSPITYSNSTQGSGNGSSISGILNSTGQAYLGNVISGISSVVSEFIPYMIYIALGILVATLGFIAVKRLMSYTSKKVTGLFISRRRK